jgi:DNA-binding NarL/FixJ family response regulator
MTNLGTPQTLRAFNPAKSTVLIVEDNAVDAQLTARAMQKYGVRDIKHVTTAEEAMLVMNKKAYEILITDYHLPRATGLELLTEVGKRWPDTRVILVTGAKDDRVAAAAIKAGAADYVSKDDFLTSGLINAVHATLRVEQDRAAEATAEILGSSGGSSTEAKAQIKWLTEGTMPAYSPVLPSLNLNDPGVANAIEICHNYLARLAELFPERPYREEDGVLAMLLERGSSPQEVFLLFERAFSRLEIATRSRGPGEVSFSPGLALARVLSRLLEAYQAAWSYQSLEEQSRPA